MRVAYERLLIAGFLCFGLVHVFALVVEYDGLAGWTKPVPVLLLAAYVVVSRRPRLLVAGLLFSAGGDLALEWDRFFLLGMALFAAAHVCYIALFVRHRRRFRWPVVAGYLVGWLALITLLWPGLDGLRIQVAGYSLLLTATAVTSAFVGWRAGLGGGLFWFSDALIAVDLAGWERMPYAQAWVMVSYLAAQFLFATAPMTRAVDSGTSVEPAADFGNSAPRSR